MSQQPEPIARDGVRATRENQSYGSHAQNLFDIWLATSQQPTPLVIFIHGGGFQNGHRWGIYKDPAIPRFLKAGVSFATIDYRYHDDPDAPRGMRDSLCDCRRALQFMRFKAAEWNIDKTRVGAYGASAGGGASLWLAFHGDMADALNDDPVLRESTRLTVVGAQVVQATYDILRWPKILGRELTEPEKEQLYEETRVMLRLESVEDLHSCAGIAARQDLDFLQMMSWNDRPLYLSNKLEKNLHDDKHHPLHTKALWRRARAVGLEVRAYAPWIDLTAPCEDLVDFFLWHLLKRPHLCTG
jgi:hypothetical protein